MKKVRFAILGCGSIGKRHAAVIDSSKHAVLEYLCDINKKRCSELTSLYGHIPCTTDPHELLKRSLAEVVVVAAPHHMHAPLAIAAAHAGKHVLVEKPMALSVKECRNMIEAARQNKVKLWVVKQNRYNVPVRLSKDAIDRKKLGKIFMVQCNIMWNRVPSYYTGSNWRGRKKTEGGALYTQASHFIDLMIWFFGDIVSANGFMDTKKQ